MELKGEYAEDQNPKIRHHLLRKLSKAVHHAQDLATLCVAVGDSRTSLEADTYCLLMLGLSKLERGQWKDALEAFVRCRWSTLCSLSLSLSHAYTLSPFSPSCPCFLLSQGVLRFVGIEAQYVWQ